MFFDIVPRASGAQIRRAGAEASPARSFATRRKTPCEEDSQ